MPPDAEFESRGARDPAGDHLKDTYDPNEISVWPLYPPVKRLPMAQWSKPKATAVFVVNLLIVGALVASIWWIVAGGGGSIFK